MSGSTAGPLSHRKPKARPVVMTERPQGHLLQNHRSVMSQRHCPAFSSSTANRSCVARERRG